MLFHSAAADEIRFLLRGVDESNYDSTLRELLQFVEYGAELSILLLQTCLNEVKSKDDDIQKPQLKPDLISAVFKYLLDRPNFCTTLSQALGVALIEDGFLEVLSNTLNLSIAEKIGVGLALSESENMDTRLKGQNFCVTHIEGLLANPASVPSNDCIQEIFMFLFRSEGLVKHMDTFTKLLTLLQLKQGDFCWASPTCTDDTCAVDSLRQLDLFFECSNNELEANLVEIEKEMSMSDIIRELGYGCTVNTLHCIEVLRQFLPLTELTLAKLIGTIACDHVGLEDSQNINSTFCSALGCSPIGDSLLNSWNVDVLVDSINQLAPETNWAHVIQNFDYEGFKIPDEASFLLIMSIYRSACQDPFPLHAICGSVWKNTEGQVSFLRHAVAASPDVFTFSHCLRKLAFTDAPNLNVHGNEAWKCLDLLEVLCLLAESGHASSVRLMLEYPIANCPDLLLAGIGQINTAYNLLQFEVYSSVFPSILKDKAKYSVIGHLWATNPNLIIRGFLDALTDPNNFFTILDICQELKILLPILATAPFSFSIKLAAVASLKEHLNLEAWLEENLDTCKDVFFEECLVYLNEIFDVATNAPDSSLQPSKLAVLNACQETCSTFLKVLQSFSSRLSSPQLFEEFRRLYASLNPKVQDAVATYPRNSEGSSDVIEAEANAYFHQMFSGQLTIEAVVQMLARFRESPEKREQSIFDCMIHNLFEEYKFFPKYPDKQLKLAAILFGSLIKHQLVTHLTLGIALRGVLDALRKSVDSKMFVFGAKALEQFMDRLVEWPQYCNHILQISHLRGSHAELVSVIERTLARISSSQTELNGGNSLLVDQQQGSPPAFVETVEPSDGSWPLSSGSTQFVQPLSPFQMQGSPGFSDERLRSSVSSSNYPKTLLPIAGQSSGVLAPVDSITGHKATASQSVPAQLTQNSASNLSVVPPSPGFARSTRPTGVRQPPYTTGFGAALNIETLVAAAERRETPLEAPAPEVQDKISFMINNISTANVDAKSKELTDVLKEQYYPWFAQYMVMKRASIEPNFHDLYMKFLEKVNSKSLNKEILKASYENCKVLLRSDLIKSSSEERSLLKNLGSWLGKLTIGRNQALLAKEIDPKFLIVEAYEKGLMIAVIPFTSKILEPCQSSLAYKPPNPWTMGILGLLVEIYNLPNLKMNLKFDIEVLFKNLGVEMKDVMPTSLLKDKVREVEGNPDFSKQDVSAAQAGNAEVNTGSIQTMNQPELQPEVNITSNPPPHPNVLTQYTGPLHLPSNTMLEDDKVGAMLVPERIQSAQGLTQVTPSASPFSSNQLANMLPRSDSYININPKLSSMGLSLSYHRIIQVAMDGAIREIVAPVIQRSVTIASRTTKELILKDYAMESDDSVISRAACLMVGALAGSLAHVTCKEPLRVALVNHLRNLLQNLNVGERAEQIVQILTTDHLDLGCAMIEDVASGKAVELIDGDIGPSFASMRKQRELAGSAYYDAGTYGQGPFGRVPEALRPKPGRLSVAQQRVYNDFIRNVWQSQPSHGTNIVPGGPPGIGVSPGSASLPRVYGSSSGQINSGMFPTLQVATGLNAAAQTLDPSSEEIDRGSTLLSVSSAHSGTSDGPIQSFAEPRSIASSIPSSVTSSEMHLVEPSNMNKESASVLPLSPTTSGSQRSESLLTTADALDKFQLVAQKLESSIAKDAGDTEIQAIVTEVLDIILRCVSRDEAALAICQKVFKSLYENSSSGIHVACHLAILEAIHNVCKVVVKELTNWVIYSDEDQKFNKEITVGLIRSELLNLVEYNVHLAKLLDGGRNKAALEFTISLVHALLLQEPGFSMSELYNVMDVLNKLAVKPGAPESLQQLTEMAKNAAANTNPPAGFTAIKEEKIRQAKDKKILSGRSMTNQEEFSVNESITADPPGFYEKVSSFFDEWCRICDHPVTNDTIYGHYISQLQQNGWLKGDDITDRVFRIFTVLSVGRAGVTDNVVNPGSLLIQSTQQLKHLSFFAIDAYAKFVVLALKYCSVDQGLSKSFLLPKILSVTVRVIQKDAEEKKASFNPRPYFRLFVNFLLDLTSADPVLDGANFQVLTAFANAFHALQPLKVPGWSFAWLELVSHRSFMPKLLTINSPKGWPFFQRLLVDLFKFMEPYLRKAELGEPVHFLYKGTLRVLLVLLHDFPEFLCDYHFSFCDVIPPSCIQMRNVILSAFPRNMRLPDPSTPNLKIDLLAEISLSPRILSDVDGALKARQIKHDIDVYLKTKPEGSSFLSELKQRLLLPQNEASLAGTRYDVPLINSLVLYVGMQAIQQLQSKSPQHVPSQQMSNNPPMDIFLVGAAMDIFKCLIKTLDTEGRYLFLNAVANQLRYPNNHTHYFSFILLFLFAEDIIQEQITRVLLERLIVNRPHPWGLLITFIELIKNPRYDFWSRSFTRCDPEIEKLFQQVSRSCGGPKTLDDGIVTAGISDGNH